MPPRSSELGAVWLGIVSKQWDGLHPSWELLFRILGRTSRLRSPDLRCLLVLCKCSFLCQSNLLSESMHWIMMLPSLSTLNQSSLLTPSDASSQSEAFSLVTLRRDWPTLTPLCDFCCLHFLLSAHCRSLCRWSCRDQDASLLPIWRYRQHSL